MSVVSWKMQNISKKMKFPQKKKKITCVLCLNVIGIGVKNRSACLFVAMFWVGGLIKTFVWSVFLSFFAFHPICFFCFPKILIFRMKEKRISQLIVHFKTEASMFVYMFYLKIHVFYHCMMPLHIESISWIFSKQHFRKLNNVYEGGWMFIRVTG